MTKDKKQEVALNIHQKLAKLRERVPFLKKDRDGFKSKYIQEATLLLAIQPVMNDLGMTLEMEMLEPTLHQFEVSAMAQGKPYDKKVIIANVGFKFAWVNTENPSDRIEKTIYLQTSDAGDPQKMGGLMTYANRYFITKNLNIPTGEKEVEDYRPPEVEEEFINDQQVTLLEKLINGNTALREKIYAWLNITAVNQIKPDRYNAVMNSILEYKNTKEATHDS